MPIKIKLRALYVYLLISQSCRVNMRAPSVSESCLGRCGHWWSLPCSCHATCVVYNNCCEDMSLQCPDILKESQAKFDENLHDHAECTEYGVFMITGCPSSLDMEQNDTILVSENTTSFPEATNEASMMSQILDFLNKSESIRTVQTMLSSTDKSMKSLGEIFLSAPVTDASTGLVYKNFTIFCCDATNLSVPHIWKISLGVKSHEGLDNVQELSHLLNTTEITYAPPDQMFSVSHCRPDCTHHCQEGLGDDTTESVDKCEDGEFTYIHILTSTGSSCYKNMGCVHCNMNKSVVERYGYIKSPAQRKLTKMLSVLLSLSDGEVKIIPGTKRSELTFPWEEMTCALEKPSVELEDVTKCQVKTWKEPCVKRPDGICRYHAIDKFAVADDDFPLTADDIRILPKFVECLIKEAIEDDEVIHIRPDVTTVYDTTLNTTLHITYVETFAKVRVALFYLISSESFVRLSAIAKSFRQYRQIIRRSSTRTNSTRETSLTDGTDESHSSNEVIRIISSVTITELSDSGLTTSLGPWDRGMAIDNLTKTSVCMCRGTTNYECRLQCVQDQWYLQENKVISEFLISPCITSLGTKKNKSSNDADTG